VLIAIGFITRQRDQLVCNVWQDLVDGSGGQIDARIRLTIMRLETAIDRILAPVGDALA
jgi:hypothetical protein